MKRYDLVTNYRCGGAVEELEPAEDGEWVRYEDVAGRREAPLPQEPPEVAFKRGWEAARQWQKDRPCTCTGCDMAARDEQAAVPRPPAMQTSADRLEMGPEWPAPEKGK